MTPSDPQTRKKARITAIVLALNTIISLVFLVYAVYSSTVADHLRVEAEANAQKAISLHNKLLAAQAELAVCHQSK